MFSIRETRTFGVTTDLYYPPIPVTYHNEIFALILRHSLSPIITPLPQYITMTIAGANHASIFLISP